MVFLTLEELSRTFFNILNQSIRTPVYTEGSTYYISDAFKGKGYTGIVYLKNCDMTTTSLHTNLQYKFKKGSLVLLPENSKYFSVFTNITSNEATFYCLNSHLYTNDFKKIIVEKDPMLIFEKTPEDIINHIEQKIPYNASPAYTNAYYFTLWDLIFKNMHLYASISTVLKNNDKTNDQLAKELNVSVSTLTRMFKKYYNTTPAAYVLSQKISTAKVRLSHTNIAVSEIAQDLGFNSPEHFSRIFKKHVGVSPIKYRKTHTI